MANTTPLSETTAELYYDGRCPICCAEVSKLRRLASDKLHLNDIHSIEDFTGIPKKRDLLDRLHLKTAEGHWLTGLDANLAAWEYTSLYRYARILSSRPIKPLTELAYRIWLMVYKHLLTRSNNL